MADNLVIIALVLLYLTPLLLFFSLVFRVLKIIERKYFPKPEKSKEDYWDTV